MGVPEEDGLVPEKDGVPEEDGWAQECQPKIHTYDAAVRVGGPTELGVWDTHG